MGSMLEMKLILFFYSPLAEEGAKREPGRAKPQVWMRRAKRRRRRDGQTGAPLDLAQLLLRLRPIGLALRATPEGRDDLGNDQ